jgi:hypothetical protein
MLIRKEDRKHSEETFVDYESHMKDPRLSPSRCGVKPAPNQLGYDTATSRSKWADVLSTVSQWQEYENK